MPQTTTHRIYYPGLLAIPDVPADMQKAAESIDVALSSAFGRKQDVPVDGTAMLTRARGQSQNPVTVWGAVQNTTNSPTNGQNIQFQWADTKVSGWTGSFPNGYRLRVHVDAREGQAGQTYHDVSWAPSERRVSYSGFGYSQSTNKAVVVSGLNGAQGSDIHFLWLAPYVRAQIDSTWVGDFAYITPSSIRFKDVEEDGIDPTVAGEFVDDLSVSRFTYKNDPTLVGSASRGREHVGFIAEDVKDLAEKHGLPNDMVEYDDRGLPKAVSAVDLIAVLWSTVQDLRKRVAELEDEARPT